MHITEQLNIRQANRL